MRCVFVLWYGFTRLTIRPKWIMYCKEIYGDRLCFMCGQTLCTRASSAVATLWLRYFNVCWLFSFLCFRNNFSLPTAPKIPTLWCNCNSLIIFLWSSYMKHEKAFNYQRFFFLINVREKHLRFVFLEVQTSPFFRQKKKL